VHPEIDDRDDAEKDYAGTEAQQSNENCADARSVTTQAICQR
jgi:hypothetical protein